MWGGVDGKIKRSVWVAVVVDVVPAVLVAAARLMVSLVAIIGFVVEAVVLLCIPWDEIYPKDSKINIKSTNMLEYFRPALNVAFLALSTVMLVDSTYNPFIYFRF